MRAIFISYRREDAEGQAGRLFDDLVTQFGEDSVFMDVAGIEPGRDFRRAIDEQVASCSVLLAVIGKSWFDAKDESGRRRLDDPVDFVRLETASALKRDIPVIPVLVRGASMPRAEQLPSDMAELAYRNGVELTHARWDSDVQVLVKALRPHVQLLRKDVASEKIEPAAGVPGKAWTAAGTSGEPGAGGTAADDTAQSAKKSWRLIVAMSLAGIAVAVGGYVGYEKVAENLEEDRIAARNAAVDQGRKAEAEKLAADPTSKIGPEKSSAGAASEASVPGSASSGSIPATKPPPDKPPTDKPQSPLPAGVISDTEDSVQIVEVSPPPGSYLHRGQPQIIKMKVAYSLQSTDVGILSMSVAQIREIHGGCSRIDGQLTDSTEVQIRRGRHMVDIAVKWSGDVFEGKKGHVDVKGYLGFVPMFWRTAGGARGDNIRQFVKGYESVCIRFGP